MGYRSVVEPLPDMLEDSIPYNKEGKKGGRGGGMERKREGRRETEGSVCGGGGFSSNI